jgi:hypothetical protein
MQRPPVQKCADDVERESEPNCGRPNHAAWRTCDACAPGILANAASRFGRPPAYTVPLRVRAKSGTDASGCNTRATIESLALWPDCRRFFGIGAALVQWAHLRWIINVLPDQHRRHDLPTVGVHRQVQLAPSASCAPAWQQLWARSCLSTSRRCRQRFVDRCARCSCPWWGRCFAQTKHRLCRAPAVQEMPGAGMDEQRLTLRPRLPSP